MSNFPQASRNTDPQSSHLAEAEINKSGARQRQADLVLARVKRFPGRTAKELTSLVRSQEVDRYTFSRRLPDLEHQGLVEKGPIRRCKVGGRKSVTWYPASEAQSE